MQDSIQLRQVSHLADVNEFEGVTNSEFNRNFESELVKAGVIRSPDEFAQRRRFQRATTSQ